MKQKPQCLIFSVIIFLTLSSNATVQYNFNASSSAQNFTIIYRDYLQNLVNIMDTEKKPCDNFFQHACGNFEQFQKGSIVDRSSNERYDFTSHDDSPLAPFLYNKHDYYMFFATHKQDFETVPGILMSQIYDMCNYAHKQNKSRRRMWLNMINDIPFLKNDQNVLKKWPFLQYQWDKYEEQLDLNWLQLAAEFSAHGLNTFINIFFAKDTIYITPNDDIECPGRSEVIKSILTLLRGRNGQIAHIIGTELWLLCQQLKGNIEISGEHESITNLLIFEFVFTLLPRLNLTDVELRNFTIIDRFNDTITPFQSTHPRIIYNFILWQAYLQYSKINNDCFQLAEEFENLLLVEYWNWYVFKPHFSRDVAVALYIFHTTRFQRNYRQFITSNSWERLFQKSSERKDLNIERSIKNYAKQYLDKETYSLNYKSQFLETAKPTYYSHLLELRRLKLRYSFVNAYEDTEQDLHFFKEFIHFSILLMYRPRLHYFASHDLEMWQQSKVLQNTDGLYAALDCLNQQTSLYADESDLFTVHNMHQIVDIFNFYTAFIEALFDYKFWLESENFAIAEDFILNYFKLDTVRIIFYAVAQQYCGRNDAWHSVVINRSFMNMPEFQEAFKCSADDIMNPVTKCMINQCLKN